MAARSRRHSWWAIGALALGALWMLVVGCLFLTGYWATVTVTGGSGDGLCDVVWEDDSGRRLSGESDCHDEPVGSRFEVRVSGWPDAGEPTLAGTYLGMGLTLGLPPVALGAGRLVQLAWRRRVVPAPHLATPTVPEGSGGALTDRRTFTAVGRARRRARLLVGSGAVGACSLLAVMAVEIEADDQLRAVGVTTVGTVEQVEHDSGWTAGAASVRFSADGVTATRRVTLGGYADDHTEGDVVDVVYDPADPDRFIIDDALYAPAWTGWVLPPALMCAFVAPAGVVRLVRVREMRRLLADRTWAPVRARTVDRESRWDLVTADGSVWRSGRYLLWLPEWAAAERSCRAGDGPAWWVSDGTVAVFADDPGGLLVLARRRR